MTQSAPGSSPAVVDLPAGASQEGEPQEDVAAPAGGGPAYLEPEEKSEVTGPVPADAALGAEPAAGAGETASAEPAPPGEAAAVGQKPEPAIVEDSEAGCSPIAADLPPSVAASGGPAVGGGPVHSRPAPAEEAVETGSTRSEQSKDRNSEPPLQRPSTGGPPAYHGAEEVLPHQVRSDNFRDAPATTPPVEAASTTNAGNTHEVESDIREVESDIPAGRSPADVPVPPRPAPDGVASAPQAPPEMGVAAGQRPELRAGEASQPPVTAPALSHRVAGVARGRASVAGGLRQISRAREPHLAAPHPSALHRPPPKVTARFLLPDPYLRWNRGLAEHCLLEPSDRTGPAYLSITPGILAAALEAEGGELLSPEDAALDFVAAVSRAYQTQILSEPEGLWTLAALGADDVPHSVAFLALSVLAAYQMHSDEEAGSNAYYRRLASLLGCDLVGEQPRGFDPVDFDHLWDMLASWLEGRTGRTLALPGPDPGPRRHIAYPLSHVPLRQVDIEKLPDFFDWAGLEPGSKANPAFLGEAFQHWASARGSISRTGESAIADERRPAVEAQLSLELEAWDGSSTDRYGSRTAAVHVLLDFRRHQPQLFFLPRRPLSFPARFDDGSHVFEAGELGWYDRVPMTADDGPALESGFRWVCSSPRGPISLHRPPSSAIALPPAADFTGYLSQRGLPLGVKSAVLCAASMEAAVEGFLTAVTSVRCRAVDHPDVPDGWCLFSGIIPKQSEPPPPGLDALTVESAATVILRGGLRLSRRAAWLDGAPPTILVGGPDGLTARIDGRPADIRDGLLDAVPSLGVGTHMVEVGRVRRRLEIAEPEGRWDACAPLAGAPNGPGQLSVALPPGSWTVIGARPEQVARGASSDMGTLVAAPFRPVWAVSLGPRRGAAVLCLTEHPPAPEVVNFGRARPGVSAAARAWASAIYDAHVRRPRLGWGGEPTPDVDLRAAWRSYWLASRALKRRWRRLA
jgi:hypothetical protein